MCCLMPCFSSSVSDFVPISCQSRRMDSLRVSISRINFSFSFIYLSSYVKNPAPREKDRVSITSSTYPRAGACLRGRLGNDISGFNTSTSDTHQHNYLISGAVSVRVVEQVAVGSIPLEVSQFGRSRVSNLQGSQSSVRVGQRRSEIGNNSSCFREVGSATYKAQSDGVESSVKPGDCVLVKFFRTPR